MSAPETVWLRSFYRRSWRRLALGVALAALQTFTLLPLPVLIQRVFDVAIPENRRTEIAVLAGSFVALTVLSALTTLAAQRVTLGVTERVARDLRRHVLGRLNGASRQFHVNADQGRVHDMVIREIDRVDIGAASAIADMVPSILIGIGMLGVLISIDWLLTLVTVACGVFFGLTNKLLLRWLDGHYERFQTATEGYSRSVMQLLRVQDLMRLQGAQATEEARVEGDLAKLERSSLSRMMATTGYVVSQQSVVSVVGATILLVGGLRAAAGTTTIGDLISFYAGFALLRSPLSSGSGAMPAIVEGRAALGRLHRRLAEIEPHPYTGQADITLIGELALDHVRLRYEDKVVLDDVTLHVRPGRTMALVGPNGCGKSSAVNVLLGLYKPESGTVRADGVAYDLLDMVRLNQQIGVVPQVPFFFPGTIRENLLYGAGQVSNEELHRALHFANAWEFVQHLPHGLDTELSDDALTLSGGQRQRLAVARALIRQPAVLVLDEPTNHLDRTSVTNLLVALRTLDPNPAVVIVTHDTSVLGEVDEIVRMEEGRIVARTEVDRSARPRDTMSA